MASLDGFKPPKQKHSLYMKLLRTNRGQIETISCAYQSPWLCGEPRHLRHGRNLRLLWSSFRSFLRFSLNGPAHSVFSLRLSALVDTRTGDCLPKRPRLTYAHEKFETVSITLNILGMVFSKTSVSSPTISSATLSAKNKIRCSRSKIPTGI